MTIPTTTEEWRLHYLSADATIFEASVPGFPLMLLDEEFGVEYDLLSEIAEQTDDERDWSVVADLEAVNDHQVFEGYWK